MYVSLFSERYTGEEWLIREEGGYLPGVYEEVSEGVVFYFLFENVVFYVSVFFLCTLMLIYSF